MSNTIRVLTADRTAGARVLVVDDVAQVQAVFRTLLGAAGHRVETAGSADEALRAMEHGAFDVILTDIDMPGMDGIQLLEQVRQRDLDVPVIMITGLPSTGSAIRALELGALAYLLKPVEPIALVQAVAHGVSALRLARAKRQALELAGGVDRFIGDLAGLTDRFDRALTGLRLDYQPIVSVSRQTVFGYEALLRSAEPSLATPGALLDAATRLHRMASIGRGVRRAAAEQAGRLPPGALLFVNLHPDDLLDDTLLDCRNCLADFADRVVLEITECAPLDGMPGLVARLVALRDRGFRIALDDFGAGYSGLTSFALLEPDVVKLDMALVRGIHRQPTKRTLVATMVAMCKELGTVVLAEGIETVEERDTLIDVGCDLMQGFLFGRPTPPFSAAAF